MTWKRKVIRVLDNGVGRSLLCWIATARARQLLGEDIEIGYRDGVWYHRVGRYFIPDGTRFEHSTTLAWKDEVSTYFRNAEDFWFRHYRPKSGDVVIDIGAGRGEDALAFACEVGLTGKVVAVEAHPATYDYLRRFCQWNGLTNVVPVHAAVMDKSGTVRIDEGTDSWQANTVRVTGRGFSVPALTVDEICQSYRIDRVNYLKINIEGAERWALLGMRETLPRLPEICVCSHDFRADQGEGEQYRTRDFVTDFLIRSGYTITQRSSDARAYVRDHIFGTRRSAAVARHLGSADVAPRPVPPDNVHSPLGTSQPLASL